MNSEKMTVEEEKERIRTLLREVFLPRTPRDRPFTQEAMAEFRSGIMPFHTVFPEDLPYRVGQIMGMLLDHPSKWSGDDLIKFLNVTEGVDDPFFYFSLQGVYSQIMNEVESLRKGDLISQERYQEFMDWLKRNEEWDASQREGAEGIRDTIGELGTDEFSTAVSSYLEAGRELQKSKLNRIGSLKDSQITAKIDPFLFFTQRQAQVVTQWLELVRGWEQFHQNSTKIGTAIAHWRERAGDWAE
jgi:hypothetical protein